MSIEEAVQLVIDTATLSRGGEVFVTKMPAIRIQDLADVMIQELAPVYGHVPESIHIQITGHKPGEKMFEELINLEETRRSWELSRYYVVLPAFTDIYRNIEHDFKDIRSKNVTSPYNSANVTPLSKAQLTKFLKKNNLLPVEAGM